jgi:hypothetical protein
MNCRFGLKQGADLRELPTGRCDIACELAIGGPGEFSNQLHLFVDDGGTREIVFTVHGVAAASK